MQGPFIVLHAKYNVSEKVKLAFKNGMQQVTIFFTTQNGMLPRNRTKQLKKELNSKIVTYPQNTNIKISLKNKLLIVTKDKMCAKEIVAITDILGISVTPYIHER